MTLQDIAVSNWSKHNFESKSKIAIQRKTIKITQLRLGAKSVSLLSTLRDPTQLRQRQCATKQRPPKKNSKENSNPYWILRWHKKSPAIRQKKFPGRQKKFGHPLCDVWNKKTQILIEFLDGTKKVQLSAKKSFLIGKKSFRRV